MKKIIIILVSYLAVFNAKADSMNVLNNYKTNNIAYCGLVFASNYGYLLKFQSSLPIATWKDKMSVNDAMIQTTKFARENKDVGNPQLFKNTERQYESQLASVQPAEIANKFNQCYEEFKPLAQALIAEKKIRIVKY